MPTRTPAFLPTLTGPGRRLHAGGATPFGVRHIDLLGEGTFEGPRLRGAVLPGGIDQKLIRADGAMTPNVRLVLETDDGALIYMAYTGIRHGSPDVMRRIADGETVDPSEYYLRNTPYFETAADKYDWLNRTVTVGNGATKPTHSP